MDVAKMGCNQPQYKTQRQANPAVDRRNEKGKQDSHGNRIDADEVLHHRLSWLQPKIPAKNSRERFAKINSPMAVMTIDRQLIFRTASGQIR